MQLREIKVGLLRRRHRAAEPARRPEAQPVALASTPSSRCSTSGGSSGQLRDELGVLPPGDILRCALALARNEGEARRVLLARLPTLEHERLGGHTGGNLLLSMMQQYSGDFLAAVDGLRALLGCQRPRLAGQRRAGDALRRVRRRHHPPRRGRGRPGPRARPRGPRRVARAAGAHPCRRCARPSRSFDAVIIGPGSFFTSLMPTLLVDGVAERAGRREGPDHPRRQPADRRAAACRSSPPPTRSAGSSRTIGRPVDVVDRQHGPAVGRGAGALRAPSTSSRSTLGDAADGTARSSSGDFWLHGHRAPRSPPAVVRGLVGARATAVSDVAV